MMDSRRVPTPLRRRMPWIQVAAMKTLMTEVDHSVDDAWSRQPKGSEKQRSPMMSKAR